MITVRNNTDRKLIFILKLGEVEKTVSIDQRSDAKVSVPYYPLIHLIIRDGTTTEMKNENSAMTNPSGTNPSDLWSGFVPYSSKPIIYNGINLSVGNLVPPSTIANPAMNTGGGKSSLVNSKILIIIAVIIIFIILYFLYKKK